ncbi:DUF421 domain-containing protein [Pacificimonas flava]|uniref:DUF421 domain-containing protein n=2 Tax=Pacificimonas TaxID=1960290 RepID=A0A219B392_9SPHN|nr:MULTISPECIES: YetF domain-containing protein [Pacificimonas]MBZ6378070.1 DUF421 domain-containing protein [Pacificimonas aurantium]OWV32289.1 DUF421 domain-containing protein [Pacificimonas flava]
MFVADPTLDMVLRGLILTAIGLLWIVLLVRVTGLRSFSKMTNFDFVMTVAVGSTLSAGGTTSDWTGFGQAMTALVALFLVQFVIARIRKSSDSVEDALQNQPAILMRDGRILHEALSATRVTETDLIAKLREANVLHMDEVRAVVLETTGDISVLHGEHLEERLLAGTKAVDTRPAAS